MRHDPPIIDAHTHLFPDPDYGRRWQEYLGHEAKRTGHLEELLGLMDEGGIDRAVILLYPRSGERYDELTRTDGVAGRSDASIREEIVEEIRTLNRWGCELAQREPRLIPFVGVNARFMTPQMMTEEIDAGVDAGARGAKIIPPSVKLYANDPLLWPIYEHCARIDLPLLSQSGSGGGPPPTPDADHYGRPRYFDEVLTAFPRLRLILAHLGLSYEGDIVALLRAHDNVWTDTSLRLSGFGHPGRWDAEQFVAGVREMGVDRVMFGTNFPMANPADYVRIFDGLPFDDDERQQLLSGTWRQVMRD